MRRLISSVRGLVGLGMLRERNLPLFYCGLLPLHHSLCELGSRQKHAQAEHHKGDWWKNAKSIYEFSAVDIDGNEESLEKYRDHVCIIVNVASKCGGTPKNYQQLQAMYDELGASKGLHILAFPCNQFASQEPGSNEEIKRFAQENFGVKFDMFSKIEVNGDNAHPLWKYLKHKQPGTFGDFIKWNFSKFLIDTQGQPVERYAPNVEPFVIKKDLPKYW